MRLFLVIGLALAAGSTYLVDARNERSSAPQKLASLTPEPAVVHHTARPVAPGLKLDETGAFEEMLEALKGSLAKIQSAAGYQAVVEQQVQIDDVMRDPVHMHMTLQHEPFSVYLKWKEDGQEALYVDGRNDGRLLVRPTRGIVALRGNWRLRPDSSQALRDARYPITEIGIAKLSQQALTFHSDRDYYQADMTCVRQPVTLGDREHVQYEVTFTGPEKSPEYARSLLTFDPETGLLVAMENYEWTPDGKCGDLLERYVYRDIEFMDAFPPSTFDERNPQYSFHK